MPIGRLVERLFPLKAPEYRRDTFIPARWISRQFRLERDVDYLCYIQCKFQLLVGTLLLALILIDSYAGTALLIPPGGAVAEPSSIPVIYSRFIRWTTVIITAAFYLRIRLPIDLSRELLPFRPKTALLSRPRRYWIIQNVILVGFFVAAIFKSDLLVLRVVQHFEASQSLLTVLIVECWFGIGCIAILSCLTIGLILLLEKAIRFFTEAQEDMLRPDDTVERRGLR